MTAINILKQKNAVHLISDGASYDSDLHLVSVGPKVFALPHINAAIAIRGPSIVLPLLAHFVGHAAHSYDHLRTDIVDVLKEAFAQIKQVTDLCRVPDQGIESNIAIVGFSERSGQSDAYVVSKPAWSVTAVPEVAFMPTLPEIDAWVATLKGSPVDEINPCDFGLKVLEMQRAARWSGRCHVGGFGLLSTVSRGGGFQSTVLRRWNDTVGNLMGAA